ncbi:MAG: hypothetical protein ACE5IG_04925 [Dehalococcoidia bacterium]
MSLVDEAVRRFNRKPVIIVSAVQDEGVLQEVRGTLVGGSGDCLFIEEVPEQSPTLVNTAWVAWLFEAPPEAKEE